MRGCCRPRSRTTPPTGQAATATICMRPRPHAIASHRAGAQPSRRSPVDGSNPPSSTTQSRRTGVISERPELGRHFRGLAPGDSVCGRQSAVSAADCRFFGPKVSGRKFSFPGMLIQAGRSWRPRPPDATPTAVALKGCLLRERLSPEVVGQSALGRYPRGLGGGFPRKRPTLPCHELSGARAAHAPLDPGRCWRRRAVISRQERDVVTP